MKYALLLSTCVMFSGVVQAQEQVLTSPLITDAEKTSIVASVQDFSTDMYAQLRAGNKGNLFFSPGSIAQALSMTYAGARDQTADEIHTALRLRMTPDYTHAAWGELIRSAGGGQGGAYSFHTANALWVQKGFEITPQFSSLVKQQYGAAIENVDFEASPQESASTINSWVQARTAEKIKELITADGIGKNTRLVLTNAIYFKADWKEAFPKSATLQEEFFVNPAQTSTAWMMTRSCSDCRYAENENFQTLGIPYKGDDMEMIILLPRDKNGLTAFEESFNMQSLREGIQALAVGEEVNIALPRFRIESGFALSKPLIALGMKTAFDEARADFSGITGKRDLYISAVVHKAFVEVDEAGTEAAAATGVMMGITSAPISSPKQFRADHPFLFLIRSTKTGEIHFMGRVTDPN